MYQLKGEQLAGLLSWVKVLEVGVDVEKDAVKKKWKSLKINKTYQKYEISTEFHYRLSKDGRLEVDLAYFYKKDLSKKDQPNPLLKLLPLLS